jgi:hypothetical protein
VHKSTKSSEPIRSENIFRCEGGCNCKLTVIASDPRAAQEAARDRGWCDIMNAVNEYTEWFCPACGRKHREKQIADLKAEIARLEAER